MVKFSTKYAHALTSVVLFSHAINGKSAETQKKARKAMRRINDEVVDIRETLAARVAEVTKARKEAGENAKKLKVVEVLDEEVKAEVEKANKDAIIVEIGKDLLEAVQSVFDGFNWDKEELKGKFSSYDMFSVDGFIDDLEAALK